MAGRAEDVAAAAAFAAEQLAGGEGWADRLEEVLARLGAAADADRAYLYQNLRDPSGRLWMDLCAEWDAPGVRRIFDSPGNHLHPYAPDFSRWLEILGGDDVLQGAVSLLPDPERGVLAAEGVVSLVIVPVRSRGEWWGFVGLDDCRRSRVWSVPQVEALAATAAAIGSAVAGELAAETRRFTEEQFRSMVEVGPAITYIDAADEGASTLYISPQIEGLLGYPQDDWLEDPNMWERVMHPDDRDRALSENARHNVTGDLFRLEYRMIARDGRVVWVHDEATMVRDDQGQSRFSHGVMMDVTERKRGEEQVAFHAYHDELTALPSRAMFEELLELSVARARR